MTSASAPLSVARPRRDPLLGVAILAVALVYVRALAFTPIEARQGAAQKILYIHATSAFIAQRYADRSVAAARLMAAP